MSARHRASMDYFCLSGQGIRVGYPSVSLLRGLSAGERRRVSGRAVLALTANPFYALRGVYPGESLSRAARRLRMGRGFHIGLNWWYLVSSASSNGVLKVRGGVIQEIGIADRRLTAGRAAAPQQLRLTHCQ